MEQGGAKRTTAGLKGCETWRAAHGGARAQHAQGPGARKMHQVLGQ